MSGIIYRLGLEKRAARFSLIHTDIYVAGLPAVSVWKAEAEDALGHPSCVIAVDATTGACLRVMADGPAGSFLPGRCRIKRAEAVERSAAFIRRALDAPLRAGRLTREPRMLGRFWVVTMAFSQVQAYVELDANSGDLVALSLRPLPAVRPMAANLYRQQ